jgi:hypothetical protein
LDTCGWLLDDLFDAAEWVNSEANAINGGADVSSVPVLLLGESFGGIVFKALLDQTRVCYGILLHHLEEFNVVRDTII